MLFLIGIGLCDGSDITVRGKEFVRRSKHVYLEGYTSLLRCSHEELERELGTKIEVLSRTDVESGIGRVLEQAREHDVALLIIGDPFGATTHADLFLRAAHANIRVQVVHNASILTAVGATGLSLYKFGRTVSVPYWQPGFEPTSFLDGIAQNRASGLHTLCLLDINAHERTFMTVAEAIDILERAERSQRAGAVVPELRAIALARIGWPEQQIIPGTLGTLKGAQLGDPPHALVIAGPLHPVEEEMLAFWEKNNH